MESQLHSFEPVQMAAHVPAWGQPGIWHFQVSWGEEYNESEPPRNKGSIPRPQEDSLWDVEQYNGKEQRIKRKNIYCGLTLCQILIQMPGINEMKEHKHTHTQSWHENWTKMQRWFRFILGWWPWFPGSATSQNFVQLETGKSQVTTHDKGFTFQAICLLTVLVLFKNKITGWGYLVFL